MRPFGNPQPDDSLAAVLKGVRRRWRLRVFLRGAVIALAIALVVMLASSAGLQKIGYAETGVSVVRWLTYGALAAVLVWLVVMPLLHSLPDERVALYVEEHEPTLELALLSAVEPGKPDAGEVSPALRKRLVKIARERARGIGDGRRVERSTMMRTGGAAFAMAASAALIVAFGPAWLRQGATVLFAPWRSAEAATPYAINIEPGNIQVPKGGDVEIIAHLQGFLTSEVEIAIRRGIEGTWERIPMGPGTDSASLMVRLFDLDERTDYYVEANGIRSPVFRIDVTNLPYVSRLDLEYHFPAYTGRASESVQDGGDITALRGTRVSISSFSTIPATAGRIILDGSDTISLVAEGDSALGGDITIKQPGSYRIELQAADGRFVPASLDYMIDVLDDGAPSVHIRTPGRDAQVTSVEEVYIEAEAEDDYRVQKLELAYSVNGGPEQVIVLQKNGHRNSATAGHTLYLEEMGLVPGDLVSYHARASDGAPGRKAPAKSDIYFLNVRPFSKDYRQSQQNGGGGGGGGGMSPQGLSSAQREVIAGTFNVVRDRPATSAEEFQENVATLALAQGRLRERVEELVRRINERGMGSRDSNFARIAAALDTAGSQMADAEEQLGKREPDDAMSPEQKALQQLQHAEAVFRDVQVSMGSQGQGGGQGGAQAQDLADLFELNTDKLRNQYETVRQSEEQQADEQVDEAMERLRRLAARQQQENEQLQRASAQSQSGSSGGGNQRAIAEEAEKLARQLERLSREQQSRELEDAARRLRESAAAMRRAAANSGERGANQGSEALENLREARRLLEESHAGRLRRDIEQAQRTAREMSETQKQVSAEAERLAQGQGNEEELRRLEQQKDAQARQAETLEAQLDRIARNGGTEQPEAARQAQEAARGMREDRLRDRIEYSKRVVRSGDPEYTRNFEEQIGAAIERARERIDRAADAVQEGGAQPGREALEKARDLVRSMESMGERLDNRANDSSRGQQQGQTQNGQQRGSQQQGNQQQGNQQQGGQQQGSQQQGGQQQGGQQQGGQQQGGQQQGGQPPDGQANGGPPAGASGGRPRWAGAGRPLTPDERRQLEREYGARRADAEALRRELRASGQELEGIDEQIARLRQLEGGRGFDDPRELERLHQQALEGLKAYEFALRRSIEGDPERPLLNPGGEVPPGFKAMVEEYYKSLAKPPR